MQESNKINYYNYVIKIYTGFRVFKIDFCLQSEKEAIAAYNDVINDIGDRMSAAIMKITDKRGVSYIFDTRWINRIKIVEKGKVARRRKAYEIIDKKEK